MAIIPILVVAAPIAVGVLAKLLEHVNEPEDERRVALEKTPVTKVAALKAGEVAKVCGRIEAFERTLVAPFSDRPSVLFELLCAVWDEEAVELTRVPLAFGVTDFWVADETGRLLVRAGPLARLVLPEQIGSRGQRADREFIESRYAAELEGRALEWAVLSSLDVGEEVAVHGRIGIDPSARDARVGGYRDATGAPSLVLDPRHERIVSDHPAFVG